MADSAAVALAASVLAGTAMNLDRAGPRTPARLRAHLFADCPRPLGRMRPTGRCAGPVTAPLLRWRRTCC